MSEHLPVTVNFTVKVAPLNGGSYGEWYCLYIVYFSLLFCVAMEPSATTGGNQQSVDAEQENVPDVTFKLQFGKTCSEVSMPLSATIGELKQQAHKLLGIPPEMQKLLIKGSMKPDTTSLQTAGVKKGLRIMLIGSRCACILLFFCA